MLDADPAAVSVDRYARSGERWATGASIVYRPIADALIARSPHPLAGRAVLDAGAGTGAATDALAARGAQPIATDFSFPMLAWESGSRSPCAVADIASLPFARHSVDDAVAAFVLNHLAHPDVGLRELLRVTRPGGAVLACVFSNRSRSPVRDRIDELVAGHGWRVPAWYIDMKATVVPLLGGGAEMERVARSVGLAAVEVDETAVDVGVTEPGKLVQYRLGQAQFADWLDDLGPDRADEVQREVAEGIRSIMEPYRPIVAFLAGRAPSG